MHPDIEIKRTPEFTANIRRSTVPQLTDEQYAALLADQTVQVAPDTADYMIQNGFALKEN